MPEHRIQTSRGEIVVRDTHVFEIIAPVNDELVLSFHGEKISFLVSRWLENEKSIGFDGKRLDESKI